MDSGGESFTCSDRPQDTVLRDTLPDRNLLPEDTTVLPDKNLLPEGTTVLPDLLPDLLLDKNILPDTRGSCSRDPLIVEFSSGPDSTLLALGQPEGRDTIATAAADLSSMLEGLSSKTDSANSHAEEYSDDGEDEDEDEDEGPVMVCSFTLGGPTVVIEEKVEERVQDKMVEDIEEKMEKDNVVEDIDEKMQLDKEVVEKMQEMLGGWKKKNAVTQEEDKEEKVEDEEESAILSTLVIQLPDTVKTPKIEVLDSPETGKRRLKDWQEKKKEEEEEEKKKEEKPSVLQKILACFKCQCFGGKKKKEEEVD